LHRTRKILAHQFRNHLVRKISHQTKWSGMRQDCNHFHDMGMGSTGAQTVDPQSNSYPMTLVLDVVRKGTGKFNVRIKFIAYPHSHNLQRWICPQLTPTRVESFGCMAAELLTHMWKLISRL